MPVSLIYRTYEKNPGMPATVPIVTHVFTGASREQAESYARAHMHTDAFFADCVKRGRYLKLNCRTVCEVVAHAGPLL